MKADDMLSGALKSLFAVSENYPDLKANQNFLQLQTELSDLENKIAATRRYYNSSVKEYENALQTFPSNIIANRILVTTIYSLIKTKGLNKELKDELVALQRMLFGIEQIDISSSLFKSIRLNRNNQFYGFVLNVCQIIFENILPSESPGKFKFSDFSRDENKMNQLFEGFIRNFYKIEQKKFSIVKKETIKWQFTQTDNISSQYLPQMETDITLENEDEKIIIDAKYYRETMTVNYDKERIKSGNLYQLFSYLLNQEDSSQKTKKTTGILIYPTIEKDYNLDFKYQEHKVQIRTLNLNTNWINISKRLKEIVLI